MGGMGSLTKMEIPIYFTIPQSIVVFRENKNQYLMSFLSVLVELEIFSEVTLDFMLVGHTGNQVRDVLGLRSCKYNGDNSNWYTL